MTRKEQWIKLWNARLNSWIRLQVWFITRIRKQPPTISDGVIWINKNNYALYVDSNIDLTTFTKMDKIADGEIMINIMVENIPSTLKKIVEHGGSIDKEKTEIGGDMGYYALFRDNSGNLLGLWSEK